MMEHLSIKKNNSTIINNLIRIGDLVYFEGPLLTLFEDANNGHLYLFDWINRDSVFNRWLVYRVSPSALYSFISKQISHLELFKSNPDDKIYTVDIETNHSFTDYNLSELNEVPIKYLPNTENYFDESDSPLLSKIRATTIKALTRKKQDNEYLQSDNLIQTINHNRFKGTLVNRINTTRHLVFINKFSFHIQFPYTIEQKNLYNKLKQSNSYSNRNLRLNKRNKLYA